MTPTSLRSARRKIRKTNSLTSTIDQLIKALSPSSEQEPARPHAEIQPEYPIAPAKYCDALQIPLTALWVEIAPEAWTFDITFIDAFGAESCSVKNCVLARAVTRITHLPCLVYRGIAFVARKLNGKFYIFKFDTRSAERFIRELDKENNACTGTVTFTPLPYSRTAAGRKAGKGTGIAHGPRSKPIAKPYGQRPTGLPS